MEWERERSVRNIGGVRMGSNINKECANYFKSNKGFKRVFEKIKDKYCSLGNIGGSVKISSLSSEEQDVLSSYLGKDCYKKSITISLSKFNDALNGTRYGKADFEEVLKIYFNGNLYSNKEIQVKYEKEKEAFFSEIIYKIQDTIAAEWILEMIKEKKYGHNALMRRYNESSQELQVELKNISEGLNYLSQKKDFIRLALLSSQITYNPHYFDDDRFTGKLLLYGITYMLKLEFPSNAEERNEILFEAGVIKDDISNYTVCFGMEIEKEGEKFNGAEEFFRNKEPLHLSIWNIKNITKIKCQNKKLYVFENPSVFSEILSKLQKEKVSLLCTAGQPKLASLLIMDKAIEEGAIIHYSGDIDPEGIRIADNLKKRYTHSLKLWRFSAEDYNEMKSNESITQSRLNKLDNIQDEKLKELSNLLKANKKSAYQEVAIDRYLKDILEHIHTYLIDTHLEK